MDEILRQLEGMFAQATEQAREEGLTQGRTEGRETAFEEVKQLCEQNTGGTRPYTLTRTAARTTAAKPRKNPWLTMTPREKENRVRKMLAGRGLQPKK